ncbi:MAG: class I SAM-dependent methyltransferase [Opitutaceae bacterium]
MNKYGKLFLSLNLGLLVCFFRKGPKTFSRACRKTFDTLSSVESDLLAAIPEIPLQSALSGREVEFQLPIKNYVDGMLPSEHALALVSILVAEQPAAVLEIGTYMGHTSKLMACNLPSAEIHTVDLPLDASSVPDPSSVLARDDFHLVGARVVGREFKGHPCANRIIQHYGDTAHWNFAEAGSPSFFFIDGCHTYDYVKNDSEKCLALCASRPATFLWHDCDENHPGILQFLQEWRELGRDVCRIRGTSLAYWKKI